MASTIYLRHSTCRPKSAGLFPGCQRWPQSPYDYYADELSPGSGSEYYSSGVSLTHIATLPKTACAVHTPASWPAPLYYNLLCHTHPLQRYLRHKRPVRQVSRELLVSEQHRRAKDRPLRIRQHTQPARRAFVIRRSLIWAHEHRPPLGEEDYLVAVPRNEAALLRKGEIPPVFRRNYGVRTVRV